MTYSRHCLCSSIVSNHKSFAKYQCVSTLICLCLISLCHLQVFYLRSIKSKNKVLFYYQSVYFYFIHFDNNNNNNNNNNNSNTNNNNNNSNNNNK